MAQIRRFHLEGECYHVSSVTHERAPLLSSKQNAQIVVDALQFQRRERAFLLGYVVMSDHFHAVFSPKPGLNISQLMQSVKGFSARVINSREDARGRIWQRSFYDHIIRSERELFATIEYIHLNPIVAELATDPDGYEFSSAGKPESNDLEAFYGNAPRLESLGYKDTQRADRGVAAPARRTG